MTAPIDLFTRVAGPDTAATMPILCLHGHPGSAASMTVFTERLSQRYRTLAPDLRGYGQSRVSQPFVMTDHLTDLNTLLDRYEVERGIVLGWSLGGILAMELAIAHPDRVAGLILIATAARPRSAHPAVSWQDNALTVLASLLNAARPGWPWAIEQLGRRSLYRYLVQQHTPQVYRRLADEGLWAYLQTSRFATDALQQALRQGYNRLSALDQIDCPVLLLAAEQDVHITAEASLETASRLSRCTVRLYPEAAHLFPWECPDRVLQDIEHWLETTDALR